jgi:hypothetical protein
MSVFSRPRMALAIASSATLFGGCSYSPTPYYTYASYFGHFPPTPPPSAYFRPLYPLPQFHSTYDPPSWGGRDAAAAGSAGAGGALLGAAGRSAPEALAGTTALRAESNVARKAAIATEDEEGFEVLRIFLWIFEL